MSPPSGDPLDRHYSVTNIGWLLAELLSSENPTNVIDLGAGQGALTEAVAHRWPSAKIVTVDIDAAVAQLLTGRLQVGGGGKHAHHTHDVLDPDLPGSLLCGERFDIVISNPPYRRVPMGSNYWHILGEAGLSRALKETGEIAADVLFLAQSLRVAKDGSMIAMVVPDAVIAGSRYRSLRQAIMEGHQIIAVVQLPRQSFSSTEAQAYLLVLRKDRPTGGAVRLLKMSAEGNTSAPIEVDQGRAARRMDYEFHAHHIKDRTGLSLASIGATITRGTITAAEARRRRLVVFHTSDFGTARENEVSFDQHWPTGGKLVLAEAGDILLARIDRRLEKKIVIVNSGVAALSDFVYRIRVPTEHRDKVFAIMTSHEGRNLISSAARGIGARVLSKSDLLTIPF